MIWSTLFCRDIVSLSCNLLWDWTVTVFSYVSENNILYSDPIKSLLILLYLWWGVKLRVQKNLYTLWFLKWHHPVVLYPFPGNDFPITDFPEYFLVIAVCSGDIFIKLILYDFNIFLLSAKGCFRETFSLREKRLFMLIYITVFTAFAFYPSTTPSREFGV